MSEMELYRSVTGLRVCRRHFRSETSARAGAVFVHGLGDHGGRHERHLQLFAAHGIPCTAIDLPGHGRSEGLRGHVPSLDEVMEIIHENLEVHRRALGPEAPLGVLGHSMGGFIALNFLARYPEAAEFSWVSSPLIDPAAKASWLKRTMGLLVERIHPEYVLQSEVTSDQCKRDQAAIAATKADPLVHRQMTVRLGAELLSASRQLQVGVRSMRSDLKLLMTQGGEDTICPAVTSRRFFEQLPVTHKEYALFPELLHEPFNDIGKERFYIRLQSWLVDRLQKSWNAPPLPKAAA